MPATAKATKLTDRAIGARLGPGAGVVVGGRVADAGGPHEQRPRHHGDQQAAASTGRARTMGRGYRPARVRPKSPDGPPSRRIDGSALAY